MKPQFIIVHHSGNNYTTFDKVDAYHKSKGWDGIGYHYFIEKSGEIKKGRKDNEIGAHCKADGMNYKSIGICLSGNLLTDLWTPQQLQSLEKLLFELEETYKIDRIHNVLGHQEVKGASTDCPGYLIYWLKAHRYSDPRFIKAFNTLEEIKKLI
jgi:N-acetylmuramoyl-L-alanine amidase